MQFYHSIIADNLSSYRRLSVGKIDYFSFDEFNVHPIEFVCHEKTIRVHPWTLLKNLILLQEV
jgi:hypothetical protein